jgi:hypothetical protein
MVILICANFDVKLIAFDHTFHSMTKFGLLRYVPITILLILQWGAGVAHSASVPDTAKVGSYVISLHDINFHDKQYVVRFWVWMTYSNPNINFKNRVEVPNAKEMEVQDALTDTSDDGVCWVMMKLRCVMKQNWSVIDFPFDKQHLEIRIENSEFDTRSLVFVSDTVGAHYDPDVTVDGWSISHFATKTGVRSYPTNFGDATLKEAKSEYATYIISLDLKRNAWGLFMKLFVGMYIAFLIAFLSFNIDFEEVDPRFGLPVGGLFGSIGNKYIIDSVLPESSLFTLVDSLHALTFISIFVILAISVYSLRIFDSGDKARARRIDKRGRNLVLSIYVGTNLVLILIALFG